MALTIDNLEIQIQSDAKGAANGIETLAKTLERLKTVVGDSSGLTANLTQISTALKTLSTVGKINLTSTIKQLTKIQTLVPSLGGADATQLAQNLTSIATSLSAFSTIPKTNITPLANGIMALNSATASFDAARLAQFSQQMQGIASGLAQLNVIQKGNLGSVINQLRKIPEVTKALDPATIDAFSAAIKKLVAALAPLAAQMETIYKAFSILPARMRSVIKASNQVASSNGRLKISYNSLFAVISRTAARLWTLYYTMQRVINIFADAFNESNKYIESLNLFKVSMGDAADAAYAYAEAVSKAMGIDVAEWITNQGTFMRMSTGFGIASEQAEIMSQNLTQLAYDMSSFFNTDVETAMDKLQSGMSGQIKGLKAWGYNLSVAALQETALSLGIEQSVRTMTEAQKAQLRYITLIQKSNGIMGDMAKTIRTPANALRVLQAQITRFERALGNVISVLITKYIPYVMAFVQLMEEAATSLAEAWGFEIPELPDNNLELGAEVIEGIGDNANDTEEDLKDLKKQLMGFDELNILKDDSGNSGAEYDLGFEMPSYDFMAGLEAMDLEPYKEKVKEILDIVMAVGAAFLGWKVAESAFVSIGNFTKAVETLGTKVGAVSTALQVLSGIALVLGGGFLEGKGIYDAITEGLDLSSFVEEIVGGGGLIGGGALIGAKLGSALIGGAVGGVIAGIPMFIANIYDAIVNDLDVLNGILIPLGSTLSGAGIGALIGSGGGPVGTIIGGIVGVIVGGFTDLGIALWQNYDAVDAWYEGLSGIGKVALVIAAPLLAVGSALALIFAPVAAPGVAIAAGITLVGEAIVGVIAIIKEWGNIGDNIREFFTETIPQAWDEFTVWLDELPEKISQWFDDLWQPIRDYDWTSLGENLGKWIGGAFRRGLEFVTDELATFFSETLPRFFRETLPTFFGETLPNFLFETLPKFFFEILPEVIGKFRDVGKAIRDGIFDGLNALGEAFNDFKEGFIEGFEEAFNGIDLKTPHLSWSFDEPATGLIGKTLETLGLPASLPKLSVEWYASGGFPATGEMFIAREMGPELVGRIGNKNAVANNEQITTAIASAVYNAMMAAQGGNGGGQTARIVVQIGERVVGEAAVEYINGQIVQTGVSPIYS